MERTDLETRKLLEKILCVLKIVNNKTIAQEKKLLLKNATKKKIYNLCNGSRTVNDIANKTKTTQPNVSQHLSSLLESGLVLFDDIGGSRYYKKSLE